MADYRYPYGRVVRYANGACSTHELPLVGGKGCGSTNTRALRDLKMPSVRSFIADGNHDTRGLTRLLEMRRARRRAWLA
jgi:hypothetical protein